MTGHPVDCRIFDNEPDARRFEDILDKDVECTAHSRVPRKGDKWVYGTRSERWELVDQFDRDYKFAISQTKMREIGFEVAKERYLSPRIF